MRTTTESTTRTAYPGESHGPLSDESAHNANVLNTGDVMIAGDGWFVDIATRRRSESLVIRFFDRREM
jgi:hypothetical protein